MILTGSRLITGPLFAIFFLKAYTPDVDPQISGFWLLLAFIAALLLEFSDMFDGMVARARNEVTSLGKIFDPICDAISRQTIFLAFLLTGIIPIWMFLIFLYRDSLIYLLRIMVASEGTVMAASWAGKFKAITQAIATFLILGALFLSFKGVEVPAPLGFHIGFWIMLIPSFFTIQSAFEYYIPNWGVIKRSAQPIVSKDND
jgi:CDP-diacylglycerol--glycerol-3-phosphate 3-phosphatidyltransferase